MRGYAFWMASLLCLAVVMGSSLASGDEARDDEPGAPWKEFEREISARGLPADTHSLMELARTHHELTVRWLALEILGLRGERDSLDSLRQLWRNETEPRLIRETAAVALARIERAEGVAALRQLLDHQPDSQRRVLLATLLAGFGDASGYRYVVQAATSSDTRLRYLSVAGLVAFLSLQHLHAPDVRPPLELLLALAADEEAAIRNEVLIQLPFAVQHGIKTEPLEPLVTKMAEHDPSPQVQETARLLLVGWHFDRQRETPQEDKKR